MCEWIKCICVMGALMNPKTGFLHEDLKNIENGNILITYITKTGRRYVDKSPHSRGCLLKKPKGKVIAFMPLPEPYKGYIKEQ